jgi:Skp family chaperone for outer membrane proteins
VKKMLFILAGFAVLVAGAYSTNFVVAQPAGNPGAGAQAQQGTRIAVVNIGEVFNKYKRAIAIKAELEGTLDPYKKKAKKLNDEIKKWSEDMTSPTFKAQDRPHYESAIVKNQRELQDMDREIKTLLGKKQEDNLVMLWKEVNMGIKAVAEAYGFQIVLGYGDPMEKEVLDQFPNVNRKMQAMDLGSTAPLYVHGSVDLSKAVVDTLNSWVPDAKKVEATKVSGTK